MNRLHACGFHLLPRVRRHQPRRWRALLALLAVWLPAALALAQAEGSQEDDLVLTAIGPLHALTSSLLEGTGVEVRNLPEAPRPLADLPALFGRQDGRFDELFERADAVVTISKLWAADPLYTAAREINIRVVEIDASRPWSTVLGGIPVARSPVSGAPSPYAWTSPSVLIRMLAIVARDLQALFPEQSERVAANLRREREAWAMLQAEYEARFLEVEEPSVYLLADEFVYLTRDFGLFVTGQFVKQDIDWTATDLEALRASLEADGVRVVLHKWQPSAAIAEAVAAGGAHLAVLDPAESRAEDLRAAVRSNLDALLAAFLAPRAE